MKRCGFPVSKYQYCLVSVRRSNGPAISTRSDGVTRSAGSRWWSKGDTANVVFILLWWRLGRWTTLASIPRRNPRVLWLTLLQTHCLVFGSLAGDKVFRTPFLFVRLPRHVRCPLVPEMRMVTGAPIGVNGQAGLPDRGVQPSGPRDGPETGFSTLWEAELVRVFHRHRGAVREDSYHLALVASQL